MTASLLIALERREHDYLGLGVTAFVVGIPGAGQNVRGRLDAVKHGHPDVHQHDVGTRLVSEAIAASVGVSTACSTAPADGTKAVTR